VMLAMLVVSGTPLTWRFAALPAVGLLTVLVAFAAGSALAALNVMYRDVRYVVPFMTQLWMFASPVIYPVRLVPPEWRWAFYLNPMAGAIDGFRAALLGTPFNVAGLASSAAVTLVMVWGGLAYFRRVESRIADLV